MPKTIAFPFRRFQTLVATAAVLSLFPAACGARTITASPSSLTFGSQKVNSPGQPAQTITFQDAQGPSGNPRFVPSITGPDAGDFLWGQAEEAGMLYVTVSFLPRLPGTKTANVVLTDNTTNSIVSTVPITGSGSITGTLSCSASAARVWSPLAVRP